jgi:hypothetical protein
MPRLAALLASLALAQQPPPDRGVSTAERTQIVRAVRRRGSDKPWDRASYKRSWSAIRCAAKGTVPAVSEMWLRDVRPTAKMRMIDAGVSELVVNRILGHQDGVAGRYYKLSDAAMQQALEVLTLGATKASESAAEIAAGQPGPMRSEHTTHARKVQETSTLARF